MKEAARVAVFCGFSRKTNAGERDFAYRVLEALDKGTISSAPGNQHPGSELATERPLMGKFYLVRELGERTPVQEARSLIQTCDFAVVILPRRRNRETSTYALMEYALACGAGLPAIVIAEQDIGTNRLGFAQELHRWLPNIDRGKLTTDTNLQKELHSCFKSILREYHLLKPFVSGWPKRNVDRFYHEHLIPLVLNWHEIGIYNHSVLPLSSSLDPADIDPREVDAWETFHGVQPEPKAQPYRALYFELEEAILTGSTARLLRLVNLVGAEVYDSELSKQVCNPAFLKAIRRSFALTRYASVVPSDVYRIHADPRDKKRALARNLSILLHMYRLDKWQHSGVRVNYRLYGFKTYNPYSVPTTIFAQRTNQDGEAEKAQAVWGFLRTGEYTDRHLDDDAFIVARNMDCVRVWGKHIEEVGDNKIVPLFVPGHGANYQGFEGLVGKPMWKLIRGQFEERGWRDSLRFIRNEKAKQRRAQ
jgi:hypothetical protein